MVVLLLHIHIEQVPCPLPKKTIVGLGSLSVFRPLPFDRGPKKGT